MATGGSLEERGRGLEEAFFAKENERLRVQLRDQAASSSGVAKASGLADEKVLATFGDLGIKNETAAAIALVPLVTVAWADGQLQDSERAALLQAIEESGIAPGSPAHGIVEAWLQKRPDGRLFDEWQAYVGALKAQMSADARQALRREVAGKARQIAEAAGGILGFNSISAGEQQILNTIDHAFD